MVDRFDYEHTMQEGLGLYPDGQFVRHSEYAALKAENERLAKINATLMGDDEGAPRYTTKRLKHEVAKAVERALAERAGGVKVRELDWEKRDVWYAKCPVSGKVYLIAEEEGKFWPLWDVSLPGYNTIETAKAAAQADYERRILSTLEPAAPEGRQEPRAYIVHAPEDDYYGTGPDRLQFHPLAQHDMDNGYRQTPLYGHPSEQAVTEAMVEKVAQEIATAHKLHGRNFTAMARAALKAAMEAVR